MSLPPLTSVKLPSGKIVSLGPRHGRLTLDVDLDYAGKSEDEKLWKGIEIVARTIKAIDGKPVAGYTRDKLCVDFTERDISTLVAVRARLDVPTPEELASALGELESKEALAECVLIFRLSGGAIPFELAMNWPDKKRRLILVALQSELAALESAADVPDRSEASAPSDSALPAPSGARQAGARPR
jgi:hypothetical protein